MNGNPSGTGEVHFITKLHLVRMANTPVTKHSLAPTWSCQNFTRLLHPVRPVRHVHPLQSIHNPLRLAATDLRVDFSNLPLHTRMGDHGFEMGP
jgi:hypothetical protein